MRHVAVSMVARLVVTETAWKCELRNHPSSLQTLRKYQDGKKTCGPCWSNKMGWAWVSFEGDWWDVIKISSCFSETLSGSLFAILCGDDHLWDLLIWALTAQLERGFLSELWVHLWLVKCQVSVKCHQMSPFRKCLTSCVVFRSQARLLSSLFSSGATSTRLNLSTVPRLFFRNPLASGYQSGARKPLLISSNLWKKTLPRSLISRLSPSHLKLIKQMSNLRLKIRIPE